MQMTKKSGREQTVFHNTVRTVYLSWIVRLKDLNADSGLKVKKGELYFKDDSSSRKTATSKGESKYWFSKKQQTGKRTADQQTI